MTTQTVSAARASSRRHRRTAGLLAALCATALGLSACGSTVPLAANGGPVSAVGDGLGDPGSSSPVPLGTADAGTGSAVGAPGSVAPTAPGVTRPAQPGAGTSTASTGTATGGTTSPTPGKKPTGPIKIGILVTATSNAGSFGVSSGNTITEQNVNDAIIAGLNAAGGLAGRRIVPIYAKTDTGSSNSEVDFAAACAKFTQDNRVEAVLGYEFTYYSSFERCLARKGIPHLNTGFNIPDRKELAQFPLFASLDVPTIDRRGLVKVAGAVADGVLTPQSKIGILSDTCPGTQRSLNDVLLPKIKALGLKTPRIFSVDCSSSATAAVAALQNAELQFASAGIDQVIFHAVTEGPVLLLFSISAENQGYHPGYVMSSLGNLDSLSPYLSPNQAKNVNGYGWIPSQDVPPAAYPAKNSLQTRCLALLKAKGLVPKTGQDFYYAYNSCEAFFVYEKALAKTGGTTGGPAFATALQSLGTSFASLTNLGGSLFSPSVPDAPRSARHLVYGTSCKCFSYVGPLRPIPTS